MIARSAALLFALSLLFSAAASAATTVAERYRGASRVLLQEGRYALASEDYFEALSYFERALVADPGNVAALVGIGRAHEALGQVATGLGYYRRALTIEPNNRDALKAQALAFLKEGAVEKAEEDRARLMRICGEAGCAELEAVAEAVDSYKQKTDAQTAPAGN